jgi:hypothetical protein
MILSYQLVNRPDVETDLREAVGYYKNISPELARQEGMKKTFESFQGIGNWEF